MAVHSKSLRLKKQYFHFRPQYGLVHFMQRNIKPKQINPTSFRSGQTGGKIGNDYDTQNIQQTSGI